MGRFWELWNNNVIFVGLKIISVSNFKVKNFCVATPYLVPKYLNKKVNIGDGRLNKEDIVQIEGLIHDDAIIVLDDFEGSEKGVANLFNLKTSSKLKNHYLIYPCQYNTLKNFGFTSHSLTAILIPASSIKLTSQG